MPDLSRSRELLTLIRTSLDRLIAAGDRHHGLFPSILDPLTGEQPFALPPALPGQRMCDRSFPGCNLSHDQIILSLMYDLPPQIVGPRYREAAERYLHYWTAHCASTPTGLFPWGEHAFWNLEEDRIGSSYPLERVNTMLTHDHLLQAPVWLWEKIWLLNPKAVERFCLGLDGHFLDVENPPQYNRHANLLLSNRKRKRGNRSCDFPRHSGFYILDWAFACSKLDSPLFRRFLQRTCDYWWNLRYENGLLALESNLRQEADPPAHLAQTLSLGVSLVDASELLETALPEVAQEMKKRGLTYAKAVLQAFYGLPSETRPQMLAWKSETILSSMQLWEGEYSGSPLSGTALLFLCLYRQTHDERLLGWAAKAAELYLQQEFPVGKSIPVSVPGLLLLLLTDLFCLSGDEKWLTAAEEQCERLIPLYFRENLPLAATGTGHYESQLLPGYLLRGIARTALMREGIDIGPDYTCR